jgi:hypothetical protein
MTMYDSLIKGKWWHCLPFLFTPVFLASASTDINLGYVGVGNVTGEICFRVDANIQILNFRVAATDLYRDDNPSCAYKIPVAGAGAQITCEPGKQSGGGTGLLPWQADPSPGMLPASWTGAVSETGTFDSGQGREFSQDVCVTVQWDQSDAALPEGRYSGSVKLAAAVVDGEPSAGAEVRVYVNVVRVCANPSVLWPPNHKMVQVTVAVDAQDGLTCRIVNVTCNEPINGPGDGNTDPDWQLTGDPLSVMLRAERGGVKEGRIYTIQVECTDASGGTGTVTVDVMVPHDQGKGK